MPIKGRTLSPVFLAMILACLVVSYADCDPVLEVYSLIGCHDCRDFEERLYQSLLPSLAADGIRPVLLIFDVMESTGYERLISESKRLAWEYQGVPLLKVGDRFLYGNDLTDPGLASTIKEELERSKPITSQPYADLSMPSNQDQVESPLPAMNLWLVLGAGLVDGVNPCALATLLFMVSALALGGRSRMLVASIGLCFIFGVFITYFLIGLGLLRVGTIAAAIPWLRTSIRYLTAIALGVLGVLSLRDWKAVRKGNTADLSLRLPDSAIRWMHRFIRKGASLWLSGIGSVLLGVLVSIGEFVCTGQVYLPTLVYISQRRMEGALALLFAYNLAFIMPLAAVFALVMLGFSHDRLTKLFSRNLAGSKLALAVFFFSFSALMLAGTMPFGS